MNSLSQYLNENVSELVYELKSETYLNAAKKAKKLGDPRAAKFLQAYKDNIDKEFNASDDADDFANEFLKYYNNDKKAIQHLKGLGRTTFTGNRMGTCFDIINDKMKFNAMIYVAANEDESRQIFLRRSSAIDDIMWHEITKRLGWVSDKLDDIKLNKPFTFVRVFTDDSTVEFFYFIEDDEILPISLTIEDGYKGRYKDKDCFDHLRDEDKKIIDVICKAMNQKHKDI